MVLRIALVLLLLASGCSYPKLVREDGSVDEAYLTKIAEGASSACGLPLEKPIAHEALTQDQARAKMAKVFSEETKPEEWAKAAKTLRAFGFVDGAIDLEAQEKALHGEQAIGFYLSREKKYFMVKDHPAASGFSIWFASWALDRDLVAEIVASHELVHALQDRRYDLDRYFDEAPNDDARLARRAVVEGHATYFGFKYFGNGVEQKDVLGQRTMEASGEAIERAPAILRESLLFPYWGGFVFMQKTKGDDRCWKAPPRSTEQVLHPEKYLKGEEPVAIELPAVVIPGWTLVDENTLGELQLRILLDGEDDDAHVVAKRASEGWGGDRYRVYENATSKELALAWVLELDTPEDARELVEAYRAFRRAKGDRPASVCALVGEKRVAIIEAPDGVTLRALEAVAFRAK
jgi:hypothetical protein